MRSRKSAFQAALLAIALIGAAAATTSFAQAQMMLDGIYGSQIMTPEERSAFRDRMQNAKTAEEREAIRAENHKQMSERAKERGVTLPEEPPAAGMGGGMGPGGMGQGGMGQGIGRGMGQGMGPGGMGPGSGMGPGGGTRP